jgi:heme iron utilization protein
MVAQDRIDLGNFIKRILRSQQFGVLATESQGQPYCSLVAFAETPDLASLLFVTPRSTQKYSNALSNGKASILIDTRAGMKTDIKKTVALTAIGSIRETVADERDEMLIIYCSKHPSLVSFARSTENALMKISTTYFIVASFDKTQRFRM